MQAFFISGGARLFPFVLPRSSRSADSRRWLRRPAEILTALRKAVTNAPLQGTQKSKKNDRAVSLVAQG
jgi:hypothetical protein